jgi:tetratricopeptide (TPR) repeat protein
MVLGYNLAFFEDPRTGLDHLEKAVALYDPAFQLMRRVGLGTNPGVISLVVSGLFLWMLGYPDRAQKRSEEAIDLAQKLDHAYTLAYGQFHTGLLHLWLRNPETAQQCAQAVIRIAEQHGFQIWSAASMCLQGAALVGMGSPETGLALIEQGLEAYRGLKTPPVFLPILLYLCADAYGAASRPEKGLRLLQEAKEIQTAGSTKTLASEFYMLQGELLLACSSANMAAAEPYFQQALEAAQEVNTAMLELRAALRLSRLWHQQGKTEQARELLNTAYTKVSEGFATADMKEAKDLLDELS